MLLNVLHAMMDTGKNQILNVLLALPIVENAQRLILVILAKMDTFHSLYLLE